MPRTHVYAIVFYVCSSSRFLAVQCFTEKEVVMPHTKGNQRWRQQKRAREVRLKFLWVESLLFLFVCLFLAEASSRAFVPAERTVRQVRLPLSWGSADKNRLTWHDFDLKHRKWEKQAMPNTCVLQLLHSQPKCQVTINNAHTSSVISSFLCSGDMFPNACSACFSLLFYLFPVTSG